MLNNLFSFPNLKKGWEFRFLQLPYFAEILILKISIMEVITIESQAYKELTAKINTIAKFVYAQNKTEEQPEGGWVDSYEVCTFLRISSRTLQRLRTTNAISYSQIRGKNFYRLSEIQRLLNENIIRRSDEHLQDLIKNHQLQVEQRQSVKRKK